MDAVILAAGLGTRLRPFTQEKPKPLLQVQGRPILDWTLAALPRQVNRIIVVVHHLAEQIERYLSTQQHIADWVTVVQQHPRGTGDALRSARQELQSGHFLVINGDDFFGAADLARLAALEAAVLVQEVLDPRRFGVAFLRADGTLDRLVEKTDILGPRLANTGAYVLPREACDIRLEISSRGEYEITDFLTALAGQRPVQVVRAGFWFPMGTIEAWKSAENADLRKWLTRG
jgi:NDP-sugar pyrophosphorylase family protein